MQFKVGSGFNLFITASLRQLNLEGSRDQNQAGSSFHLLLMVQ